MRKFVMQCAGEPTVVTLEDRGRQADGKYLSVFCANGAEMRSLSPVEGGAERFAIDAAFLELHSFNVHSYEVLQ